MALSMRLLCSAFLNVDEGVASIPSIPMKVHQLCVVELPGTAQDQAAVVQSRSLPVSADGLCVLWHNCTNPSKTLKGDPSRLQKSKSCRVRKPCI